MVEAILLANLNHHMKLELTKTVGMVPKIALTFPFASFFLLDLPLYTDITSLQGYVQNWLPFQTELLHNIVIGGWLISMWEFWLYIPVIMVLF